MFGSIEVLSGDFKDAQFHKGIFYGKDVRTKKREKLLAASIVDVDEASEESVVRVGGAIGWGVASGAVFGPVGALAGAFLGSKGSKVTFVMKFCDGRRLMGTTDKATFAALRTAYQENQWRKERPEIAVPETTSEAQKRRRNDIGVPLPVLFAIAILGVIIVALQ